MRELNKLVKAGLLKTLNKELFELEKELTLLCAKTRVRLKDGHKTLEIESASSTPDVILSREIPMVKKRIRKTKEAILRLKTGEYGLCKKCEEEINIDRLKEIPSIEYCIACKTEIERKEKQERKCRGYKKDNGPIFT